MNKNSINKAMRIIIATTTLFVSVFGVFAMNDVEVEAKPSETITLPGDGSTYDDYVYEKDSPVSGGYGQDVGEFKLKLSEPEGLTIGKLPQAYAGATIPTEQDSWTQTTLIAEDNEGYLISVDSTAMNYIGATGTQSKGTFQKVNKSLTSVIKDNPPFFQTARKWWSQGVFFPGDNQATYIAFGSDSTKVKIKSNGEVDGTVTDILSSGQSFETNPPTALKYDFFLPPESEEWATIKVGPTKYGHMYKFSAEGNLIDTIIKENPYKDNSYDTAAYQAIAAYSYPLKDGYRVILWGEGAASLASSSGFSVVDSNWNYPSTKSEKLTELSEVKTNKQFLGVSKSGNPIVRVGDEIREYNKINGELQNNIDFSGVGSFSQIVSLEEQENGVSYYLVGTAKSIGILAPFSEDDSSAVSLVGLDEDFNVISATFIKSDNSYEFTRTKELADGRVLVTGKTDHSGNRDLFQRFSGDVTQKGEGFIGTFSQVKDFAPKLLKPNNITVVLNGNETAAQVDEKMLAYIKDDMDGENNRYDDYTTNADLYARINKNINSNDYKNEAIDWTKFGLEATTNNRGKNTYKPGTYDVTYGVADNQNQQAVVSGNVIICSSETLTDTGDCDTGSTAKFGLDAYNYRIEKGTSNAGAKNTVLTNSNAKAWVLATDVDETTTNKVVVDASQLNANVAGVYPVDITYSGGSGTTPIVKTIYVTVYEPTGTVSGPEDPTDPTPGNPVNSDLLYAVDKELSLYEADNTFSKNVIDMVDGKGWNAYPTGSTDVDIDPIFVTNMTRVVDENNNPVNQNITVNNGVIQGTVLIGEYNVTLDTRNPGGATKTVRLKIRANKQPTLTATPIKELALHAPIPSYADLLSNITLGGDPDLTTANVQVLNKNGTLIHSTAGPTATDIDVDTPGVYTIEYFVQNAEGNNARAFTNYVVGMDVLENQYVIDANNFDIHIDDVTDTNQATLNTQIKNKSSYAGWMIADASGAAITPVSKPVGIASSEYKKAVGGHKIVLRIDEKPTATKDIYANVYRNGDITKKYIIDGQNAEMKIAQAQTHLNNGKKIVDAEFNNVIIWERNTNNFFTPVEGTNYTTPTDFAPSTLSAMTYSYVVTYGAGAEQTAETFTVKLTSDGDPTLIVAPSTEIVKVPLHTPHASIATQLFANVTSTDGVPGKPNPAISATLQLANGTAVNTAATDLTGIDTTQNGIYKYEYSTTDSQNITVKAERYYVVGENPTIDKTNDLVLFANIFYIQDTDVRKGNGPITNADAPYQRADASIRVLTTGQTLNQNQITLSDNPKSYGLAATFVDNKHPIGGYPLTFEATIGGNTIQKKVIANVVNANVTYAEGEDAIHQVEATLRRSEVGSRTAEAITQLKVWNTQTGNDLTEGTGYIVDDTNNFNTDKLTIENLSYTTNYYNIVVDAMTGLQHSEKVIQIIPGGAPKIDVGPNVQNGIVELTMEEASHFNPNNAVDIAEASDPEDTNGQDGKPTKYPRSRIVVNSTDVTNFDATTPGTYLLEYSVTDDDKNTTSVTLAYIVGARTSSQKAAIYANSFSIDKVTELPSWNTPAAIETNAKNKSEVKADKIVRDPVTGIITGIETQQLNNINFTNSGGIGAASIAGPYILNFAYDDVSTDVVASITDANVDEGDKVAIYAETVSYRPGQITTQTASDLTKVRAWDIDTSVPVTLASGDLVETVTPTFNAANITKPMVATTYDVKYTSPLDATVVREVKINIEPGFKPELQGLGDTVHIPLNDPQTINIMAGVSATDVEDDAAGVAVTITSDTPTINKSVKGTTVVTYTATDSDGNTDVKKRTYVVGAINPQPGAEYFIFANDFTLRTGEVDTADLNGQIMTESRAFAEKVDGSGATARVKTNGGYTNTDGTYTVTLEVAEDTSYSETITATVTDANVPVLTVNPEVVYVDLNGTLGAGEAIMDGVSATDVEDDAAGVPVDITADVTLIDTSVKGTTVVTYTATDSDGNSVTETRTYVVGAINPQPGAEYFIFANDFTLRTGEVNTTNLNGQIMTKSNAFAQKVDGSSATARVKTNGGYTNTDGTYTVTFEVAEDTTYTETITATVTDANAPVLTVSPEVIYVDLNGTLGAGEAIMDGVSATDVEDDTAGVAVGISSDVTSIDTSAKGTTVVTYTATDSDGNTDIKTRTYVVGAINPQPGAEYFIFANDFTLRTGEVDTTDLNGQIMTESGAFAQKVDGSSATARVKTNGGYINTDGTYTVTFEVAEDTNYTETITATVTDANPPVLSVTPAVIYVDLNGTLGAGEGIMDGVSATDVEDDAAGVSVDITSNTTSIDTSVKGTTVVTYTATDSDGNSVTKTRTYVVGAINPQPGAEYFIFANDFTLRTGEVNTTDLDGQIMSKSNAFAQKVDGSSASARVKTNGGYTNTDGTYTVTFEVAEDTTYTETITATVTDANAPVLTVNPEVIYVNLGATLGAGEAIMDGVSATDVEDDAAGVAVSITADTPTINTGVKGTTVVTYTATDSDSNSVTKTRTYVVGAINPQPGAEYFIFANDFTLRTGEVDTTDLDAQIMTESGAFARKVDGTTATARVKTNGGYTAADGTYTVTFEVAEDTTYTETITATVTDANVPVLTVNPEVIYVDLNGTLGAGEGIMDGVSATDVEDDAAGVPVGITSNVASIDTSSKGTTVVTYTATDSDGNSVTETRTYVVGAINPQPGAEFFIFANDFTLRTGEVNTADLDGQIMSESNAFAQKVDGSSATARVKTNGGYTNTDGAYTITFEVAEDTTYTATITATVTDANAPVLTVSPEVIYVDLNGTLGAGEAIMDGVSATDVEDDAAGVAVGISSDITSIDTSVKGTTVVTYTATDSDGNTDTKTRTYVVGAINPQPGAEYFIFANDFTLRTGEVDTTDLDGQIMTESSAFAEKVDGSSATACVKTNGGYTATDGTYTVTFEVAEDTTYTETITATVTDANAPVLTVTPEVIYVNLGATLGAGEAIMDGVLATDVEDDAAGVTVGITSSTPTINTSAKGTTVVTYTATDSDSNTDTKTRTYVVGAINPQPGAEYFIFANDFTLRTGEVDTTDLDGQIMTESGAFAREVDGSTATARVKTNGGYTATDGTYTVTFEVAEDTTYTETITATVTDANVPVLTVNPEVIYVDLNGTLGAGEAIMDGVSATDVEDDAAGVPVSITASATTIDTIVKGTTVVTYTATDSDGNSVTGTRTYVVGAINPQPGAEYFIFANDFTLRTGEVNTTDLDGQIMSKSHAFAQKVDGSSATARVKTNGGYTNTDGTYTVTFEVAEDTTYTETITATVTDANAPVLTVAPEVIYVNLGATLGAGEAIMDGVSATDIEDDAAGVAVGISSDITSIDTSVKGTTVVTYTATDSDGNTDIKTRTYVVGAINPQPGAEYFIFANDFTLRTGEVDTTDLDGQIMSESSAFAEKVDGSRATARVQSNGGYTNVDGTYTVTFEVAEDTTYTETITATVTDANAPVLTVTPEVIYVNLGATLGAGEGIMDGVSATDVEDDAAGVAVSIASSTPTINTSVKGTTVVTYTATDSDGNSVTKTRTYVVGAINPQPGDEYFIFANNFTLRTGEVDTTDLDGQIMSESNAFARKVDGSTATARVKANGGYTNTDGTYTVTFEVAEDTTYTETITATVTDANVPVLTVTPEVIYVDLNGTLGAGEGIMDGVSATDVEDDAAGVPVGITSNVASIDTNSKGTTVVTYTATDSDGNSVTETRTYVVGAINPQPGAEYFIFANDFTLRTGEVNTTDLNGQIMTESGAFAQKVDGSSATARVKTNGGYTNTDGAYTVTFEVAEDTTYTETITATVTDANAPVLTVNPRTITVDLNGTLGADEGIMDGVSATDIEDDAAGVPVGISANVTSIDTSVKGTTVVTYTATDSDGNSVTETRTYVVGAINPQPGAEYFIFANDFTLRTGEVDTTDLDGQIMTESSAFAEKVDGSSATARVKTNGGYTATDGTYTVTFEVAEDTTYTETITATVTDANAPVLTVTPEVIYVNLGATLGAGEAIMDGVSATDVEDDAAGVAVSITSDTPTINTSTKGTTVVTYTATDSDGNSVTGTRTYVVGAINPQPGAEYFIFANDFTLRTGEVDTIDLDGQIMTESGVFAQKVDGSSATARVQSNGGYTNLDGTYTVTFEVAEDTTYTETITATVTDANVPVLTVTPAVIYVDLNGTLGAGEGIMDGVSATDVEDDAAGVPVGISANVTSIDTSVKGTTVVTYTATDSDGNSVTETRTYVVGAINPQPGAEYFIFANDFTLRTGEVNVLDLDGQIMTESGAFAQKKDGSAATAQVKTNGGYTNADGTYTVIIEVLEDTMYAETITATVTDANAPVLTVNPRTITVDLNGTLGAGEGIMDGVSATDIEDDAAGLAVGITSNVASIDTSVKGTTVVTYTATDSDGNSVTGTRTYVVGAINPQPGAEYFIFANDFTLRTGEVNTTDLDGQIMMKSGAFAQKADGSVATAQIQSNGGYTNTDGTYTVTFEVAEDMTYTETITATVTNANPPVLTVNPAVIYIDLGATLGVGEAIMDGVSATDVEDDAAGVAVSITSSTPTINTSAKGTTVVTYTATDSDGNSVTGKRTYVVGAINPQPGAEYFIFANDFTLRTGEVNTADLTGQIMAKSGAFAQKVDGSIATAQVQSNGGYTNVDGTYTVTFEVAEDTTYTETITATVTDANIPVLTVNPKTIAVDLNGTLGAGEGIMDGVSATDVEDDAAGVVVTITSNVSSIDTNVKGTTVVTYTATDSDGNSVTETRTYVVGAINPQPNAEYFIFANDFTLRTGEVDTANVDGQILSKSGAFAQKVDGSAATARVQSNGGYTNLDGTYTVVFEVVEDTSYTETITATVIVGYAPKLTVSPTIETIPLNAMTPNYLDGVTASDVEDTGGAEYQDNRIKVTGAVDTAVAGVYVITYAVTDDDGNTTTAQRSYVVDGTEGSTYALFANGFSLKVADVAATPQTRQQQIMGYTNAKSELIADSSQKGTTRITNDGGYTNAAGAYTITFDVQEEPTTTRKVIANIFDGNEGTLDIMHAVDGKVRPSEINAATVETVTQSKAWHKVTGQPVAYTYVVTDAKGNIVDFTHAQPVGMYTVTFVTKPEAVTLQRTIEVVAGEAPVITVDPAMVVLEHQAPSPNYLESVTASDAEDTNGDIYTDDRIRVTGAVHTDLPGVYVIKYTVMDNDGNETAATRSYLVGSRVYNNMFSIFASDFTIDAENVNSNDLMQQILEESHAKAQFIGDATETPVLVVDLGGYTNKKGVYHATITVENDPSLYTEITITVRGEEEPTVRKLAIEADDAQITIAELEQQMKDGKLDAFVLEKVQGKVVDTETGETVGTPEVNANALKDENIANTKQPIELYYTVTGDEVAVKATNREATTAKDAETIAGTIITKKVEVEVIGEKPETPKQPTGSLPTTGEKVLEPIAIASSMIVISIWILLYRKKRNKRDIK